MLTFSRRNSDVQIIYVTDASEDAKTMARELCQIHFRILFASCPSTPHAFASMWRAVLTEQPFLPTVFIIDYKCTASCCRDLVSTLKSLMAGVAVEIIVINLPDDRTCVDGMIASGANITFKENEAGLNTQACSFPWKPCTAEDVFRG